LEDHGHQAAERDGHDDDHDAADGRCVVQIAPVTISAPVLVARFEIGRIGASEFFCEPVLDIEACGLAPPNENSLSISSWQFCRRTALPPRAPSLLS
jgi:hypothetical protein